MGDGGRERKLWMFLELGAVLYCLIWMGVGNGPFGRLCNLVLYFVV